MKHPQFRGTGVALVTPFRNGAIDFDGFTNVIEHTIRGGVDFLVCLGSTGEASTLSTKESLEVVQHTIKINAGRVPVVVGMFGHNDTAALVHKINSFDFSGVDAILSASPSYNKPTQEGLFQHYMAVAEVCPVPIIIYNVPGRTSSNISAATTLRLAHANDQFIAIKEASADMVQGAQIIKGKPSDFLVLSGDDTTALPLISLGGDGVISVIANSHPTPFSQLIRSALNGDFKTAQHLHHALLDLHHWLYVEGNPAGVKAALSILELCSEEVRLPLTALSENYKLALQKEMEKAETLYAIK